jgi:archaellum component FlaC
MKGTVFIVLEKAAEAADDRVTEIEDALGECERTIEYREEQVRDAKQRLEDLETDLGLAETLAKDLWDAIL